MHPASIYRTEHRRPEKLKISARMRAAFERSTRSHRVERGAAFLAFLFTLFAVFQTSGSHAGPTGERPTRPAATTSSGATAPAPNNGVEREFGLRFLTAAPFQATSESIQIFADDCTTPKDSFTLGDTLCVKATVPFSFLLGFRSINIIDPSNVVRASQIVTHSSLTQEFSFTLPATAQTTIGGQALYNRGTWRADLSTLSGSRRASAFFDASAAIAAADLQVVPTVDDDIVPSGGSLAVTIYVLNMGPDAAENVVVTPPSHSGLSLESLVDTDLMAPNNECETPCTVESLGRRAAKKFIATYEVTAPAGTKIIARASVTSDTEDPNPTFDYRVDEQNPAPPANTNVASIFVAVAAPEGNQGCTLTCPANLAATANTTVNNEFGAFVTYGAAAPEGDCGEITNNPVSGSFFAVGTHTVTSTASGGGSCTFTVKVLDTPAPTITCPANKFATDTDDSGDETVAVGLPTFTASGGGTVIGLRSDSTPAVVDNEGNIITPAEPKPLTDPYPVGVTSILWTVTDADGRTASCTQTVTVGVVCGGGTDTTPPTITAPADITVETGGDNTGCTITLDDELGQPEVQDNCAVSYTVSGRPAGNNFAPGTYTLTYTATDASGNTASDTQTVIVRETSPPIIFAPADASYTCPENVPAASPSQAGGPLLDGNGVPIRDDNGNFVPGGLPYDNCGTPTVTVTESSTGAGTPASPRVITRTFRATDASGNFSEAVQTISVIDGTAPTITVPSAVTAHTGSGATSCDTVIDNATLGTASAQDNCAGVTVTRSPAGNTFPVGTTTVVWTATDWAGNTATAEQTVTVIDNTAPVLTPPATVIAHTGPGATSCDTFVSDATIGTATATDNCPGVGTVTRTGVPAGNVFPEGTTTITYSVTDAHGNTTTAQQTVTVIDNTAPVISCPTDIVLEPSCPLGAIATWAAPVGTDNCPGATTTQTAGPASGSVFPIGTTTVTYTVNDAHGNSASCSFTVTVKTPLQVVQDLINRVAALQPPLTGTQVQGLNSKLDAALTAINDGKTNVACNKLNDFISQVTSFINNGTLTSAQGQPLITSAAKVRNTLGCTNLPCT